MRMRNKGLIHAIAECRDCGWGCENYLTAQAEARKHADSKRHLVVIDLGYVFEYDGRKEADNAE